MLVVRVGELKPHDVILVEAVTLQVVDHDGRLQGRLEVSEAEVDLITARLVSENEADRLEARVRTEDVSDFAFGCVSGDSLDVDSVGCMFRDWEDRWPKDLRKRVEKVVGRVVLTDDLAQERAEVIIVLPSWRLGL